MSTAIVGGGHHGRDPRLLPGQGRGAGHDLRRQPDLGRAGRPDHAARRRGRGPLLSRHPVERRAPDDAVRRARHQRSAALQAHRHAGVLGRQAGLDERHRRLPEVPAAALHRSHPARADRGGRQPGEGLARPRARADARLAGEARRRRSVPALLGPDAPGQVRRRGRRHPGDVDVVAAGPHPRHPQGREPEGRERPPDRRLPHPARSDGRAHPRARRRDPIVHAGRARRHRERPRPSASRWRAASSRTTPPS